MPRNPEGREGRTWLKWVMLLSYGKPLQELKPKERATALKKFYEFCTPPEPAKGRWVPFIFKWVIPGRSKLPPPTLAQVETFREQARAMFEKRLNGEKACRIGVGASPNYQEDLVILESQDPIYTAISRLGVFLSRNWRYVRRCPRAAYPQERCRRVFILKKLPTTKDNADPYCSRRCRDRINKRKEDQITEDRYGRTGRKPKGDN